MKGDKASKQLRVLVAVGSDVTRKVIKNALKEGFHDSLVHEAADGVESQTMLEKGAYDLVFCGWEIPGVPCDAVLKWVRSHPSPSVHKIFFIIVSSRADKVSVMEAVRSGANSYIMKPFTAANLVQKVASVLGRRAHKRHSVPATVKLYFGERFVRGRIVNIGMGGMLCSFSIGPMPLLTEEIIADLELNGRKVSDVDGVILRLHEPRSFMSTRKIAIKFSANMQKTGWQKKLMLSHF